MANLQTKNIQLAQGELITIPVFGDYIRILNSSGEIEVTTDLSKVVMANGDSARIDEFNSIQVLNLYNGTNVLQIVIGSGELKSDRLILEGAIDTQSKSGEGAILSTKTLAGSALKVAEYDTDRLKITFKNNTGASVTIGRVDIATNGGYDLPDGDSLKIDQAPILEYWALGTGNLALLEEFKSPK